VLRGDFGDSYVINRPVIELISARWSSTIELALLATIIMIVIGLTLGLLAGSPRSKFSRTLLDVLTTAFLGTPSFLTGLLLILLLGIAFPILPVSGEVSLFEDPGIGIQYLILPATALALPPAAFVARLVATQMIMVRGEEFIDLAVAKGVPSRQIMTRHVMRNSLGTAAVAIGLRFGDLLGGAIVVEAIFARNGLGTLAVTSVNTRDYFVVQVLILGSVTIAVIMQLLSEVALAALDPRVRLDSR
jgi:peptide/nickel transport system permease protein